MSINDIKINLGSLATARKNISLNKRLIRVFFKKLDSYIKFYFFELWTSRNFKLSQIRTINTLREVYRLRYKVYCEEYNYLNPNNYPDGLEHDNFDAFSKHFVLMNGGSRIVGYARLIFNSPEGFPIEKHFKINLGKIHIHKDKIVEISRLIVSADYRKFHLIQALIRGLYHYMKRNGIKYFYCVIDNRLYEMLASLGFTFRKIGPTTNYQGVTSPYLFIIDEAEEIMKVKNKLLLKYLKKGFPSD